MKTLYGIPVSPGIAFGYARIRYKKKIRVKKKYIEEDRIQNEIVRFRTVIQEEIIELEQVIDNLIKNSPNNSTDKYPVSSGDETELLTSHKMILEDPLLLYKITDLIENKKYTAEFALQKFYYQISEIFEKMTNQYFAERISDYEDIVLKLIQRLSGDSSDLLDQMFTTSNNDVNNKKDLILILEDISPSDVAKSYSSNVSGICLSRGSKTSHSAIISRALGLPVVVGINDLFTKIDEGDLLIIDGTNGKVIVQPDEETAEKYDRQYQSEQLEKKGLEKLLDKPVRTSDDKKIQLLCNIELEQEVDFVLRKNADGIGLFRTEYLFVDRQKLPTEEEQYNIYYKIASKMSDRKIIIRTYDLGGDKLADSIEALPENNPFLGCRGIRLSLRHPEILKTQLRAILRANEFNNIAVMFPMISSVNDVKQAIKIVDICKQELQEESISFNRNMEIGAMIEVPGAVFCVSELAKYCDFFSIGTNDLVQYTLAADRDNKAIEKYYDPFHPAVIKLIAMTIINAHRFGKPVSICGEVAAEKGFIDLIVGLGIDSISVNPAVLLAVKRKILDIDYQKACKLAKEVLRTNTTEEVMTLITNYR